MVDYLKSMKLSGYLNRIKSINICPECKKEHLSYHKGNAFCSEVCADKNTARFINELKANKDY